MFYTELYDVIKLRGCDQIIFYDQILF